MILNTHKRGHIPKQAGFSLVELMVSVSIFVIVMLIAVGTLLVLINANAHAQNMSSIMSNLSFALDSMTRKVRTGDEYYCLASISNGASLPDGTSDCANGGGVIVFNDGETGERTGYRLVTVDDIGVIQKKVENGNWLALTSVEVSITEFVVTVTGTTGGDVEQPQAAFRVEGYAVRGNDQDVDFSIQTRVVQRLLDY